MKIGEMAKRAGCQVVTIRYYEKEGLLPRPERSEGNYRLYARDDLERLEFILHCRRHGMKLDDIRRLLTFRDNPQHDCTWVTELIDGHLENVNAQIRSLEHLKQHLEQLRDACGGNQDGTRCAIMQSLDNGASCCATCERHPAAP